MNKTLDTILAILLVCVFVGLFVLFAVLIKKGKKTYKEAVNNANEEQKNRLALTNIEFIEGKNEWYQEGMIAAMNDKGDKVATVVLWHNRVIQNATFDTLQYAETSLAKTEVEQHNLKIGDFVKVYIAPEKTFGGFKIIF